MLDFLTLQTTSTSPTIITILYAICLSFVLATAIAVTYQKTFQGLSYSRSFLQTLILASVVTAIAMQAIGDNLARGLGMMGALSMIRFRASLKDTRDMIFVFASLAIGIATGVHSYSIATLGCIGFCLIAVLLYFSPFTSGTYFDGLLRFNMGNDPAAKSAVEKHLSSFCNNFALVTLREIAQGTRLDYAYQVKIKHNQEYDNLVHALKAIDSVKGVTLLLQETTVEV